jgi:hypothetical protein
MKRVDVIIISFIAVNMQEAKISKVKGFSDFEYAK